MRFKNRDEAEKQLAGRLAAYKGQNPLILGVPRDAVPMARIIADALAGELDVVLVRKLRAPGQPELAIGAVDGAGTVLKGRYFVVADEEYLRDEIQTQRWHQRTSTRRAIRHCPGARRPWGGGVGIIGCPRLSLTTAPRQRAMFWNTRPWLWSKRIRMAASLSLRGGEARGAMPLNGGHLPRLSVSSESEPAKTRALHSRESRHSDTDELHRVPRALRSSAPPVLMDGQTKQLLLAAGAAELLMRIPLDPDYREAIWDQAAGALLVEEAGGRVTDLDGLPLDFTTGRHLLRNIGLIASNGRLHDAVLGVMRERSLRWRNPH